MRKRAWERTMWAAPMVSTHPPSGIPRSSGSNSGTSKTSPKVLAGAPRRAYSAATCSAASCDDEQPTVRSRLREVLYRRAFTEELRIAHHRHVAALEQLDGANSRPDRDGGLVDYRTGWQHVMDLLDHRLDRGEVGDATYAYRRRHAEEHHLDGSVLALQLVEGGCGADDERQRAGGDTLADKLGQAVLAMPIAPDRRRSIFFSSKATQTTLCPREARQAHVVSPTKPVPTTEIRREHTLLQPPRLLDHAVVPVAAAANGMSAIARSRPQP